MPNYFKNIIAAVALAICTIFYLYYKQMIQVETNATAEVNFSVKLDFLPNKDKTGSPFFQVLGNTPGEESLPLKKTTVHATIAGVIADVEVKQSYKNTSDQTLHAIYVFPASTNAAVYAMEMKVGGRTSYAKIFEKRQARTVYEKAKKEGKSASLLEQQRPNVFQMQVANIQAGDEVEVILHYTELLIPTSGIYEFVYPTVVAPRYEGAIAEDGWIDNPYATDNQSLANRRGLFDIQVAIEAGLPVQRIQSSSHEVKVGYTGKNTANVELKEAYIQSEKDYILQYQLRGKAIETGVLLYEGEEENFFLAMVQPPQQVTIDDIPPREYVFILDVSGSMEGKPLEITKEVMKNLLADLRPEDKFNVLLFEYSNSLLFPKSVAAKPKNIAKAMKLIDTKRGSGGTELLSALKKALSLKAAKNVARSFVIVTDGHVTVEKEAFDLVQNSLGEANFFAFGIGNSINRYLIEGLGHVGKTTPIMITQLDDASAKAAAFKQYISAPVLANIDVDFTKLVTDKQQVSDVFAERPIVLFGKYKGEATGKMIVKGYTGLEGKYEHEIDLAAVKANPKLKALRYLWARNRIKLLDDYEKVDYKADHKAEITALGLTYNLLTDYTSFVAVDELNADKDGNYQLSEGSAYDWEEEVEGGYEFNSRGGTVNTRGGIVTKSLPLEMMETDGELVFIDKSISEVTVSQSTLEKVAKFDRNIHKKIVNGAYSRAGLYQEKQTAESELLLGIISPLEWTTLIANTKYQPLDHLVVDESFSADQLALLYGKLVMRTGIAYSYGETKAARKLHQQTRRVGKLLGMSEGQYTKRIEQHLKTVDALDPLILDMISGIAAIQTDLEQQNQGELGKLMLIGGWNEYCLAIHAMRKQKSEAALDESVVTSHQAGELILNFYKTSNVPLFRDLAALKTLMDNEVGY